MVDISDMQMEIDSSDVDRAERAVDKLAQTMQESAAMSALYSRKLAGEYSLSANKIEQSTRAVSRMRANYAKQEQDRSRMILNAQRGLVQMQQKENNEQDKAARQALQRSLNLQKAREQEAAATEKAIKRKAAAQQQADSKADAAFRREYQRVLSLQKAREQEIAAAERQASRQIAAAQRAEKAEDAAMRQQYQRLLTIQKAREQAASAAEKAAQKEIAATKRAEIAEANRRTSWIRESDRMTAMFLADSRKREQQFEREEASSRKHGRGIISTLSHIRGTMLSLSGIAAGIGVLALYNSLNKYTELTNLFKVLGFEGGAAAEKLREIQDVARSTRSPVEELSKIYQKTTMAASELGASQDQILRFTKNVGLALAQQGGATISTRGALLQLAQAIGMGTVRAEEFNSMLEGGYPILVAAAKGIEETGGSVMKLRQMMLAGELSSKMFFEAILSQSDDLEKVFGRTIPTLSQSLTVLRDTFMVSMGEMDHAVGFSQTLAQGIIKLSSSFVDFTRLVTENADTVQMMGHALSELGVILTAAAAVHFGGRLLSSITAAGGAMVTFTKATTAAAAAFKSFLPALALGTLVNTIMLLRDHNVVAEDFATATKLASESQKDLNTALADFSSNRGFESASILKQQTETTIADIKAALEAAEAQLEAQGFYTRLFGQELFETEAMAVARAEVTRLKEELIVAEGMLGMADGAARSLAVSIGEAAIATDGMSDKAVQAAHAANTELQQQLTLSRTILEFGEKSSQVEAVKRDQAKAAAIAFAEQKDFNDDITLAYVNQVMKLYDINSLLEKQKSYSELIANAWKEINSSNEKAREQRLEAQKTTAEYERQIELSKAMAQYGENSAQAEALRLEEIRRSTEEYIEQNDLTGDVADSLMTATMNQAALKSEASLLPPVLSQASSEAMILAQNLGLAMAQLRGIFAGMQAAQSAASRIAQNTNRINKETVGDPVARAKAIKEYEALEASGTAAYAAIRVGSTAALNEIKNSTDAIAETAAETKILELENTAADKAFRDLAKGAGKGKKGMSDAEKAAKKAAKETKKLNEQLDNQAKALKASLSPFEKYRQEMEELAALKGRLSDGEMAQAVKELNVELADSLPLVGELTDTLVEGLFNGFEGTLKSITEIFKNWLIEMIATAAKNQIIVSMGINPLGGGGGLLGGLGSSVLGSWASGAGGGALTTALGAAGAPVGATGILGGLGSVWSGVTSGFASGGVLGAIGGGFSASIGGITSGLAAGGSITAAIGSAIPIIGAVAAVVSLGKKMFGRELKDGGIDVAFNAAEGIMARTYKFYKGGWFRSDKTSYDDMDRSLANPLERGFKAVSDQVSGFAKILDLNAKAIKNVNWSFKFSTKGMSEEEIQERFQEEFEKYGNALASAVTKKVVGTKTVTKTREELYYDYGTGSEQNDAGTRKRTVEYQETVKAYVSSLRQFKRAGESNLETLNRLATSLVTVNTAFKQLGLTTMEASLQGGALSSTLIRILGGVEGFAQATDFYYQNFYSDQERLKNARKALNKEFKAIGIAARPKSLEQFRRVLERLDEAGRSRAVAKMLRLAPAFKEMLDLAESVNGSGSDDTGTTPDNSERLGLLRQLYQLEGRTYRLRQMELRQLEPANRELQKRIWALEKEQAIENERNGLQQTAARLLGNTNWLRQQELQNLNKANRGLQRWIWRVEDAQNAVQEAENAVRASAQAEQQRIDSLRNSADTVRGMIEGIVSSAVTVTEVQRKAAENLLRRRITNGHITGDRTMSLAEKASQVNAENFSTQADFVIASAHAATALEALASAQEARAQTKEDRLEAALEKYGLKDETVKSLTDSLRTLDRAIARMNSVNIALANSSGIEIPGFEAGGDHTGGLRVVGEGGPELEATGPSRIKTNSQLSDILNSGLKEDIQKLTLEVQKLRNDQNGANATNIRLNKKLADVYEKWDIDGMPQERV